MLIRCVNNAYSDYYNNEEKFFKHLEKGEIYSVDENVWDNANLDSNIPVTLKDGSKVYFSKRRFELVRYVDADKLVKSEPIGLTLGEYERMREAEELEKQYKEYYEDANEAAEFNFVEEENDMVNHPNHYADGRKYEPIDVIADWELDFALGNTVKYISRAGRKDDVVQDLEKAMFYLQYEINRLKNNRN